MKTKYQHNEISAKGNIKERWTFTERRAQWLGPQTMICAQTVSCQSAYSPKRRQFT